MEFLVGYINPYVPTFLYSLVHAYCSGHILQQITPLTRDQPPASQALPEAKTSSITARNQRRWLLKSRPEAFLANALASTFSWDAAATESQITTGQLLAVGGAVDVEHLPGYRTKPIIVMPWGEDGKVLRLLRPLVQNCGWGKKSSVKLTLMDASKAEIGHWIGTGGAIRQISFAEEDKMSCNWLAVRQSSIITIFRPMYRAEPVPAHAPIGFGISYSPSRVDPNPVAVLTVDQSSTNSHVDMSFNPYYKRQFAVVDEGGTWSIWDIEGRLRKSSNLSLKPGKRGHIYDQYVYNPLTKPPDHADGWHKVSWVSSVSTIVACSRRHLAVFDISSTPQRLQSPELLSPSNTDWILDVKRSVLHPDHLYVLTSSRIFWIIVVACGGEKNDDFTGARVILSHRHFRDPNDESMKLQAMTEDHGRPTPLTN